MDLRPLPAALKLIPRIRRRLIALGYEARDVDHRDLQKHKDVWAPRPLSERGSDISRFLVLCSALRLLSLEKYRAFGEAVR